MHINLFFPTDGYKIHFFIILFAYIHFITPSFQLRQNTPEKRWKITDEDWRNRDKWDDYETAVDEMLEKTNTSFAPWHILESNDKKYARIKALKIVIKAIEDKLEQVEKN